MYPSAPQITILPVFVPLAKPLTCLSLVTFPKPTAAPFAATAFTLPAVPSAFKRYPSVNVLESLYRAFFTSVVPNFSQVVVAVAEEASAVATHSDPSAVTTYTSPFLAPFIAFNVVSEATVPLNFITVPKPLIKSRA